MTIYLRNIIGLIFCLFISGVQAEESLNKSDDLLVIVKQYYNALENARQEHSSLADIEKLLQLLASDFKYEHPSFGANGDKKAMREGLIAVLGQQRNAEINIENHIVGLNAVFVKVSSGAQVKRENEWQLLSGPETALFEIKKGKISRIHEYW